MVAILDNHICESTGMKVYKLQEMWLRTGTWYCHQYF